MSLIAQSSLDVVRMTNTQHKTNFTLQEALIQLGYDWHEKDYFFFHGAFPIIENSTADMQNYLGIMLCTDGDIDISINEVDYNLTASTLLIAFPSSIVHIVRSRRHYNGILVFVALDFLSKHIINAQLVHPFRQVSKNHHSLVELTREEQKNLIDIYKIICRKREAKGSDLQLEALRNLLLAAICEVAEIFLKSNKVEIRSTRNEEITDAFLNLLIKPIKISHKTAYFAGKLNVSPKYLIHAVKTTTGKSPGFFINEKITDNAKLLLGDYSLNISQISEKLGFSEVSSFSSFFKKHTNLSPTLYREQL